MTFMAKVPFDTMEEGRSRRSAELESKYSTGTVRLVLAKGRYLLGKKGPAFFVLLSIHA